MCFSHLQATVIPKTDRRRIAAENSWLSEPMRAILNLKAYSQPQLVGVGSAGPMNSVKLVAAAMRNGDASPVWAEQARITALLGSSPKSHASFASGFRCWCSFASNVLGRKGKELPPTVDGIVSWSVLFRCTGTFQNYLGYLRLACQLAKVSDGALVDRAVKRATVAIAKRGSFQSRPKQFIRLDLLNRMLFASHSQNAIWAKDIAMLFLSAYVFLLRVPSECLPIKTFAGPPKAGEAMGQASVWIESDRLVLRLGRRKNKPGGSLLFRECWCASCEQTCPVHVLGAYFTSLPIGSSPFACTSPGGALELLRRMLTSLQVPDAKHYRTHDLRRGHAEDMRCAGASLGQILKAGEWRSPAFLAYLDTQELECAAVIEAHVNDESDEDDVPIEVAVSKRSRKAIM